VALPFTALATLDTWIIDITAFCAEYLTSFYICHAFPFHSLFYQYSLAKSIVITRLPSSLTGSLVWLGKLLRHFGCLRVDPILQVPVDKAFVLFKEQEAYLCASVSNEP
jgi:hypothetical protein